MKKFYILLIAMILFPAICSAQAKVYTKKVKLSDFPTKTTKVVLTGGDMFDTPLKDEIARRWHISPYEFCTVEEFNNIKSNSDYYFLRLANISGITNFVLSKEGLEVIKLPFCTANDSDGREMVYLPAFIDIMQTYVMDSINSDMTGYIGLKNYSKNVVRSQDKEIYIAREDLDADFNYEWADKGVNIIDEDEVDDIFIKEEPDAIVGYTVTPRAGAKSGRCYVFLIGADAHELYYYGSNKNNGFSNADMRVIASFRKKKKN